jgi:hypothetical protein
LYHVCWHWLQALYVLMLLVALLSEWPTSPAVYGKDQSTPV